MDLLGNVLDFQWAHRDRPVLELKIFYYLLVFLTKRLKCLSIKIDGSFEVKPSYPGRTETLTAWSSAGTTLLSEAAGPPSAFPKFSMLSC
jgi:hypothetical protein